MRLCLDFYDARDYTGPDPESNGIEAVRFGFAFQSDLWSMSCADPNKDLNEEGFAKVRCMWLKNRLTLRCYNYVTRLSTGKNVMKFAVEASTSFLRELIKKYHLDPNFIDPADGKTILDWCIDHVEYAKKLEPVNEDDVKDYQMIIEFLKSYGAKTAKELQQK